MEPGQDSSSDLFFAQTKPLDDQSNEVRRPMRQQRKEYWSTEDLMRKTVEELKGVDVGDYSQLIRAVRRKDWKEVDHFVNENRETLNATIEEDSSTLLQMMAVYDEYEALRLIEKFVGMLSHSHSHSQSHLEETYNSGRMLSPLDEAATIGNLKAAKLFCKLNKNLPNIRDDDGRYTIHYAAAGGHRETVEYILSITGNGVKDSSLLLMQLIESNLFDIAWRILKDHPKLGRDENSQRSEILQKLAEKPKAFASGSRLGFWKRLIYNYIPVETEKKDSYVPKSEKGDTENPIRGHISPQAKMATTFGTLSQKLHIMFWNNLIQLAPSIKAIHHTKLMHIQTVEIVRMVCDGVQWKYQNASETLKKPVLTATKLGIYEMVNEIFGVYSNSVLFVDEAGNNLYMLAVLRRQEKLFKLLTQQPDSKIWSEKSINKHFNNILHLAGTLVPSSEAAGAALQMQRELQWFKAVENFVHPSLQEQLNNSDETPIYIFTHTHEALIEKGEKWMKDTAQSCTVVVSLIITVMFAAAFTVPGGNNNEGIPNFLHDVPFLVFITADALALFSSTASLLMFLGILTSRYSQDDFMFSLPRKLIIGLVSMLFSIATMMVAFGATVYIVLSQPWKWVIIPISLLGCIPVTLFALLQFPLLVEMLLSTYRPSLFQPLKYGKL